MEANATIARQAQEIKKKDAEIKRLRLVLQSLVFESNLGDGVNVLESDVAATNDDCATATCTTLRVDLSHGKKPKDDSSDASDEDWSDEYTTLLSPFHDGEVHRCLACGFEVVQGECALASCGKIHKYSEGEQKFVNTSSIATTTYAIHPDRSLVPRGNTPISKYRFSPEEEQLPAEYLPSNSPPCRPSRVNEYIQLRRRGATHLMCEVFRLSFTYEGGIYAFATPQLYQEFAGPKMEMGHTWRIHLGRRVELEEDDLDGSAFIKGLLEDAIYFPLRDPISARDFEKWDTLEDFPGVWVTRLISHRADVGGEDSDPDSDEEDVEQCFEIMAKQEDDLDSPQEHDGPHRANEYESDESDDGEEEEELDMIQNDFAYTSSYEDEDEEEGTEDTASVEEDSEDEYGSYPGDAESWYQSAIYTDEDSEETGLNPVPDVISY